MRSFSVSKAQAAADQKSGGLLADVFFLGAIVAVVFGAAFLFIN